MRTGGPDRDTPESDQSLSAWDSSSPRTTKVLSHILVIAYNPRSVGNQSTESHHSETKRSVCVQVKVQRVHDLLACDRFSKAHKTLLSMGLGDLSDPEIVKQLAAKHPARQEHLPGVPTPDSAHIRHSVSLRDQYRTLKPLAGTGPSDYRNECLCALSRKFNDPVADQVIEKHEMVAGKYINAELPSWYYFVISSVEMLALIKSQPAPPLLTPDVRETYRCWQLQKEVMAVHLFGGQKRRVERYFQATANGSRREIGYAEIVRKHASICTVRIHNIAIMPWAPLTLKTYIKRLSVQVCCAQSKRIRNGAKYTRQYRYGQRCHPHASSSTSTRYCPTMDASKVILLLPPRSAL